MNTFHKHQKPAVTQSSIKSNTARLRAIVSKLKLQRAPEKPVWVNMPDSLWQRHSALIMSRYEK